MWKRINGLLPLFGIIGAFLVIGVVLISSGLLPEEQAKQFQRLDILSISSEMKVLQEPTPDHNTFIYAINEVAQRGIDIAQGDERVIEILDQAADRKASVTVAAVQPTLMIDRKSGELHYGSEGQVIITANWQTIDGKIYSEPPNSAKIIGNSVEARQQIWHILVDVDDGKIIRITRQADRVVSDTVKLNLVRADMNVFVPNALVVEAGSTVNWPNRSSLPHNVVGIFNQTTASDASASTGLIPYNPTNEGSQSSTVIDSGYIDPGRSWQYNFDGEGVFNYLCTIHAQEGMRGTLIIESP